jgi:arylsulfatase A-like enzyme
MPPDTPMRPNILWYCTDQQRFDTIGALGNPHVVTPTLDQLTAEGVAMTHAYCQSPICTPSRSSFMTGMYPSRVHNTRNGNESFPPHPPVITKLIAQSGYDCGLIGKFHLQSAGYRTEPRIDDGFSYWKFSHAPRDDWKQGHDYADWVKSRGGDLDAMRQSPERVPTEFHQTTWASDCAIEFINRHVDNDQPWLLNLNVYDPHPPFIPPKSYADRFDPAKMPGPHFRESDLQHQTRLAALDFQDELRTPEQHDAFRVQANYYAMIAQIDDQFARILETLERTGQRDRTVIVFTSDHGEALGDHGLMFKGCRFYEGLVRVPLIICWPGVFRAGVVCDGLVELLDLTSTLMELCGLECPDYMQGKSLLPILNGQADPHHHRDFVRSEYFDALDPHFTGGSGTFGTMYRTPRYKLCLYHDKQLGELYDLREDPWEFDDLWDSPDHQTIKHQLIREAFDAHVVLTTDMGSRRIAPM